ncbi:MAG: ankyrin repeat domain-containing protein [Cystobacter sp.]
MNHALCSRSFVLALILLTGTASDSVFAQPPPLGKPSISAPSSHGPPDEGQALAEAMRRGDEEKFRRLLEEGANPSAYDVDPLSDTKTPLIAEAARTRRPNIKLITLLLERGARVDAPTVGGAWNGYTALIHAAQEGQTELVRLLLKHGAQPNYATPDNGHTALMSAAGYPDVVDVLLEAGARLEAAGRGGRTAASFAGMSGCRAAFEHLKRLGANVDRKDGGGKSATDYIEGFSSGGVPGGICNPYCVPSGPVPAGICRPN